MNQFQNEALELAQKIISNEIATITQHLDEGGELLGITLAVSSEAYTSIDEENKKWALNKLGVNQNTLEYFQNSSPEERAQITRIAKIAALKSELAKLEAELVS